MDISASNAWPVTIRTVTGSFKAGPGPQPDLSGRGELQVRHDGALELRARFNPPGTGILAILATIASGFLAFVVVEAIGFAGAPGIIP